MIKIVLVDDHKIVRAGIKSILETNPGNKITGEYESAEKFLRVIKNSACHLIITEIILPGKTGIELITEARKLKNKKFKILVLTGHDNFDFIKRAFEAGVDGYLLKDCNQGELFTAIVKIMQNQNYCSSTVSQILLNKHMSKTQRPIKIVLSSREKEIIDLISQGLNNREIADKLYLAPKTVESHRASLLVKLKARNTAEMVRKAIEFKILE